MLCSFLLLYVYLFVHERPFHLSDYVMHIPLRGERCKAESKWKNPIQAKLQTNTNCNLQTRLTGIIARNIKDRVA